MQLLTWHIAEPLNFAWQQELIYLDVDAPVECAALTDGVNTIAAQYDPERRAVVACLDIPPLAQFTLTATADSTPDTGLRLEERPGVFLLRNAHCTVALTRTVDVIDAGERWVITGPIAYVVGPDALPRAGSRVVINKSRFFTHDRESMRRVDAEQIAAEETPPRVETTLLARGPVFARYRYRLTMFDGRDYTFTATLYAAHPAVYIQEETALARDGALEIELSKDFTCDQYFFGGVGGPRQTLVPLPSIPYRLGSLSPHHSQTHTAYPWLGFLQSDRPQGTFRGICDTAIEPYADALVIMAQTPWRWDYPSEMTLQFHCAEGRRVTATGPLYQGTRAWLLFVVHRDAAQAPAPFGENYSAFVTWHRQVNDLPFDWVRRLDLATDLPAALDYPRSVLTREEYTTKKQGIFTELARTLRAETQGDRMPALYARWLLEDDREALQRLAESAIAAAEAKLRLMLNSGFLPDALSAVANRELGSMAMYYEACIIAGVLVPVERARLRTILLFFANATADDALFPSHQNYWPPDHPRAIRNWAINEQYSDLFGTPNFQTDVYYNLGLFGAVFTEHPCARAWLADAAAQLDAQLNYHFFPGGVYKESIGYFAHLFHNMLSLASVLQRHGERDFYADGRFHDAMNCFVDYLGAPRTGTVEELVHPGHGGDGLLRYWPSIGDTGHNCTEARLQALVAHAAWEVRAHNPALSDHLLSAWAACGKPLWGPSHPLFEYLYVRDLQPKTLPLALASRNFVNVGVMFRADIGQATETSLFVRSGRATHHWGFDHGHFTLTSRGSLLIPDFGYHGTTTPTGGAFVHGSATWVHNIVTFGPDWNGDIGMEQRNAERVIRLGGDYQYVECDLCLNNVRHNNWRNIQHIVPVDYYRHLLFAGNRYVFVWDRIEHSIYRAQLRINALAHGVEVDGGRLRFAGLDGVDLLVHVLTPGAAEFHEGLVGPQRYLLCEQPCQRDFLWVCQPLAAGEQEFAVTHTANLLRIAGTDLHGAAFVDYIVYAKGDFGATVEIDGTPYRLDGRLAVLHRDAGGETVELLDARGVECSRGVPPLPGEGDGKGGTPLLQSG